MELEEAFEQDSVKIKAAINPMTYINGINSLSSALSTLRKLRDKLYGTELNQNSITGGTNDITYSGQHTDIANISSYENGVMPVKALDDIDTTLQANVKEEFAIAEKDGLIVKNDVDGQECFTLTEKGREHINSQEFIRQFENDQKDVMISNIEPKAVVNFKGNSDDLNIYRYTKQVNLNNESETVQKYFAKCQKKGFVNIKDGIATATDKTNQWLKRTPDTLKAKGNIKLITVDNAEDVLFNKTAEKATNTAGKHFMKETGKAVAKETGKAVAKETGKTVAKETGKAIAKGATKAATTTVGVASGAATAGVGTVITIAVEAAQLLAKQAKKQNQQLTNVMRGK